MIKFYEFLRENAMEIINFKKRKMILLTKQQQNSYENAKVCYICKEKVKNKNLKDEKYYNVRNHYKKTRNIEVQRMTYVI